MAVHQRRRKRKQGKAVRSWQFLKDGAPARGQALKIRASGALRQITPEKPNNRRTCPGVPVRGP
jgi:hypothetical protein